MEPAPSVIEAVADVLGSHFRNAVYGGQRHPLEPDFDRVVREAQKLVAERQAADGKPAEPVGWEEHFDRLAPAETLEAVRGRLGIVERGDLVAHMATEWESLDPARAVRAIIRLRCDSVDFGSLKVQLEREAAAARVAASKPKASISPTMLTQIAEQVAAGIQRRRTRGIGSAATEWGKIQAKLLEKRERGHPFTSLRQLEAELKCSTSTIRKAIGKSDVLKGWRARYTGEKASPRATGLSQVVKDDMRQSREQPPSEVLLDDEVDAVMNRLIKQAAPDELAKLNAMDRAGRRALAATYLAQTRDLEPNPLDPERPDERPRKVRHHKRP
jgi:hypothetical protein